MENAVNILLMVLVGAISGTLAARIMKGEHFGFVSNVLLGIAGAVVGGIVFNFFGVRPGESVVNVISDTFGVELPGNFVGMLISATLGSILILWIAGQLRGSLGGKKRR